MPTEAFPLPWTLDLLRNADPVLGLALLVIVAVVAGEALHRATRLPRACGQMLVGALASPLALRLLERSDLDPWKPMLDLAVGVLVFELGSRVRPRWLIDNPGLAMQSLAEALLAAAAVWSLLAWLGIDHRSAALAGAVAMATSPVITMAVLHESQPRGQVTERLLLLTALNSVLAMLALTLWRLVAGAGIGPGASTDALAALADLLYVLCGSFLLGTAAGLALAWLTRPARDVASGVVLQLALIVIAAMLALQWALSPLLALLLAGMMARHRMGHRLNVVPQLGSAGAALTVMLFVSIGLLATADGLLKVWPLALAIIVARLVGKGVAVVALARFSGLGWRQALALTLALQPMAQTALLLSSSSYGWPAGTLGIDAGVWQALLISTTLLQLAGPVITQGALHRVAGEASAARKD